MRDSPPFPFFEKSENGKGGLSLRGSVRMYVIGITGGIGAGKSTVLSVLEQEYGACVIQADQAGHLVMEPGQPCYNAIVERFGTEYLGVYTGTENGSAAGALPAIDRGKLGRYVFAHPEELQALNAIVHPAVRTWITRKLSGEEEKGTRVCVVEAALLLESGYSEFCDEVWYVYSPEEIRIERLIRSRGYTEEYIQKIFASQKDDMFYRERADFMIDNGGTPENTAMQIRERMNMLRISNEESSSRLFTAGQ